MAAITGQPAPKPGSVKTPVPGKAAAQSADDFLASFDAPEMSATPATPIETDLSASEGLQQSPADQFIAQVSAANAGTPVEGATPDQFAPEPTFAEANLSQLNPKNFMDRLQAGLAANDTEKANFLRKKYGEENVAVRDGNLYYRRNKGEKLKRLDPATFELIADIIPDFAREAVSESAMLPGELAGGAAGFFTGGPPGAALGARAGRVASVPLANAAADKTAEFAGVPQDESRSRLIENSIGMGAEALMPIIGGKIAKRIPGTAAYKAAKEAGEKEVVALSKQSKEVIDSLTRLEDAGIMHKIDGADVGVPGANVSLMLHQVNPDSPDIKSILEKTKNLPQFLNAQTKQAEAYGAALENNLREIATRGGHGPVAPEKLGETITDAVLTLDRAEGKAIGKFRAKALETLKNEKQIVPESILQTADELMKTLEFNRVKRAKTVMTQPSLTKIGGRNEIISYHWLPPKDISRQIGKLGLDDAQTRSVINVLGEYGKIMTDGNQARLTDVERLITRTGDLNRRLQGTPLAGTWGKLTGDLRTFRREIIGNALGDETEKKLFNSAMDDFSSIRSNIGQLQDVLRGDVTAKTIVNGFFKGKENLANIRALKSITGNDSAQWGALKEEFVNQLLLKHTSDGPSGFNSKAFLNDLEKNYGESFIKEVLDDGKVGPNYQTVKDLLTVGKRIESTYKNAQFDNASEQVKKGAMDTLIGLAAGIRFKTINGITAILGGQSGEKHALFELMSRDGIEKYVAGYPKKLSGEQKKQITQNLTDMLGQYRAVRMLSEKAKAAAPVAKRGAKAIIRDEMSYQDE